ncbi:MAG: 6,7-dimethyl-8-ribityllumazine synthase [Pelagibacteraceae bacterium]|nr:6,7-dimethyl-8-ribityllumazine synthase [Pelagibacteraceae bacterium]|tara:strand:- start:8539 stop:8976 length:438 start_codon:yes stop_codon:yes gene_type:complete
MKFLIVVSDYYKGISSGLLSGASDVLNSKKIEFDTLLVPGAFEIPLAISCKIKANKGIYDGYIALGCIIKGQTYHFELISNESIRAISSLMLKHSLPIGYGIITCYNMDEAKERSGKNNKNKGAEAAIACVNMQKICRNINLISS